MGYGMKYTKGGFPFKEIETGTDRVSPVSPSPTLKKAGPETKQLDVDNIDPFSIDEQVYERAQNDYDTDNPTQEQLNAAEKKGRRDENLD